MKKKLIIYCIIAFFAAQAMALYEFRSPLRNIKLGDWTASRIAWINEANEVNSVPELYWDDTNDRLGIGKASTGAKLHVAGYINIELSGKNGMGEVGAIQSLSDGKTIGDAVGWNFNLRNSNDSSANYAKFVTGITDPTAGAMKGYFSIHTVGVADGIAERVRIDDVGNVGIGTESPVRTLDVKGITRISGGGLLVGDVVPGNPANPPEGEVWVMDDDIDVRFILGEGTSSGESAGMKWVSAGNYLSIYHSSVGTGSMVLDSSGNVGIGTTTPLTALHMGNDKFIALDVNAGLTASTTQSQGQGALTAQVNEISTVANTDDTVTLPSAVTGIEIEIINNGAETLQIFPASDDNLGLGVNVAEELEANERVKFVAYNTTNWAKESTTEIIHAEIHDEDNTDAFVINDAGGDFHSYHTNGLASGDLADWTFDVGGAGTSFPIVSIANSAGSPGTQILVTTTGAHGLAVGDIISQTNLADAAYVGVFEVKATAAAATYEVAASYTATGTGTMDQTATLTANAVAAGVYDFAYYISATPVGNNETFDFQLYIGATAVVGSKIRRKFGAANDFGSMSGGGVVSVGNGDKISFALSNEDSAANLVIRNLTIVLVRL